MRLHVQCLIFRSPKSLSLPFNMWHGGEAGIDSDGQFERGSCLRGTVTMLLPVSQHWQIYEVINTKTCNCQHDIASTTAKIVLAIWTMTYTVASLKSCEFCCHRGCPNEHQASTIAHVHNMSDTHTTVTAHRSDSVKIDCRVYLDSCLHYPYIQSILALSRPCFLHLSDNIPFPYMVHIWTWFCRYVCTPDNPSWGTICESRNKNIKIEALFRNTVNGNDIKGFLQT